MCTRFRTFAPSFLVLTLAMLVGASSAQAALAITDVAVTPGTSQAGAHSSYALGFRLSDPGQQIKDLTIHLPPGLVGNPLAQPVCSETQFRADACPAASLVGTSQVNADPMNLTIDGSIYNLAPGAGEPARLGIVYRNALVAKMFVESSVSLRSADGGLDSTIKDLPRTATLLGAVLPLPGLSPTLDVTVKGITLTLQSSFITNPTSCAAATTRLEATSYAAPAGVARGEASFTPTGCEKVPFAPKFSVAITGTKKGVSPTLSTVITQAAGEGSVRGAVVTLPDGVGPNLKGLGSTCPQADVKAGTCPDASVVGSASAQTPLLRDPLAGDVYLVAAAPGNLPTLAIDLRGTLRILLAAKVGITKRGQLETTLADIPDVPLSRFALTFKGFGTTGVLTDVEDLCTAMRPFSATFTSQAGRAATSAGNAALAGCAPGTPGAGTPAGGRTRSATARARPRATATLSRRGTLTLTVRAGAHRIRGLRATLTRRGRVGRRSTSAGRVRLRGRTLVVDRVPRAGRTRVIARVRNARRVAGKRLTVTVIDRSGKRAVLRVAVRRP